jgi:hypothetical protein
MGGPVSLSAIGFLQSRVIYTNKKSIGPLCRGLSYEQHVIGVPGECGNVSGIRMCGEINPELFNADSRCLPGNPGHSAIHRTNYTF